LVSSSLTRGNSNPRFILFPPIETDKEQAEIDKLYAEASGSKLSPKLLAKRGYDPDDFILNDPNENVTNSDFQSIHNSTEEPISHELAAALDKMTARLKKK
jgi:hypothetical protein